MTPEQIQAIDDALPPQYAITSAVLRSDGSALIEVRSEFGAFTRDDFDEHGIARRKGTSKRKARAIVLAMESALR